VQTASIERREGRHPNVRIVRAPDPDFKDTKRRSITLPLSWWDRIDRIAEAATTPESVCDRFAATIQLVRWSLDLGDDPPTPSAADLEGQKETRPVYLAAPRWAQVEEEKQRRGLSLNKIFQAHVWRALVAEESEAPVKRADSPRKPKR
jgi:hypothetical protein